ncbi:MAG TPA: ABC transporter permease subunit, partial [Aquabacterium sp.]|nr:ABC transporter permease subunit [Aquabacterium sp.]
MMSFKPVFLWTDVVLWLMLIGLASYVWSVRRDPALRATWRRVFRTSAAMASCVILIVMLMITLLDSLHFRRALPAVAGGVAAFDTRTESVLDVLLKRLIDGRENSYSSPLATHGFVKETVPPQAGVQARVDASGMPELPKRAFPRLKHGGAGLKDPADEWLGDVMRRLAFGVIAGAGMAALLFLVGRSRRMNQSDVAWSAAYWALSALMMLTSIAISLSWGQGYHVLGTDRTGNDVLYISLKSIRTAFVIGSLATVATLPLALALGIAAGYFKGWVDDLIQYVYTVLSSVPNILLIAACVLMVQVFLDKHPEFFETGLERADLKIFLLCVILGVTGWAGLCRLLRAETLKLRELDYVQAATAFGVGPWRIMR